MHCRELDRLVPAKVNPGATAAAIPGRIRRIDPRPARGRGSLTPSRIGRPAPREPLHDMA